MKQPGHIVVFPFPETNHTNSKLRPALLIQCVPGRYDDWLVCMISSQLHQEIADFDEVISPDDLDFSTSGLKCASLIRVSRLAIVDVNLLLGSIGSISQERLSRIKTKIADWIIG